jgi:hypothetical protein
MRAVAVKPGMGKFPFIGTFDAELLKPELDAGMRVPEARDYYRVAVFSGKKRAGV